MISLAFILIHWLSSRSFVEVPSWRHRGTNNGYWKSVAAVVVEAVAEAVVTGCVPAMTVSEEVGDAEEGGGVDEVRL